MRRRPNRRPLFALLATVLLTLAGCARKSAVPDVVVAKDATWHERTAAAEVRRYLYLRTGELRGAPRGPLVLPGPGAVHRPARKGRDLRPRLGRRRDRGQGRRPGCRGLLAQDAPWRRRLRPDRPRRRRQRPGRPLRRLPAGREAGGPVRPRRRHRPRRQDRARVPRPRPRRDGAPAFRRPRHPALPRFPRGPGLVDPREATRPSSASCRSCG